MANLSFAQLNQGFQRAGSVAGDVLDYQVNQRALDISQEKTDIQRETLNENKEITRLSKMKNTADYIANEISVYGGDLEKAFENNPDLPMQMAQITGDPSKFPNGLSSIQRGEDGKYRMYYKGENGSETAYTGADGQDIGVGLERMVTSFGVKASAGGYINAYKSFVESTPDDPDGSLKANMEEQFTVANDQFVSKTGFSISEMNGVLNEGDLIAEATTAADVDNAPQALPKDLTADVASLRNGIELSPNTPEQNSLQDNLTNAEDPAERGIYRGGSSARRQANEDARPNRTALIEAGLSPEFIAEFKNLEASEIRVAVDNTAREIEEAKAVAASPDSPLGVIGRARSKIARLEREMADFEKVAYRPSTLAEQPNSAAGATPEEIVAQTERAAQVNPTTPRQEARLTKSWTSGPDPKFADNSRDARGYRAAAYAYATKYMTGSSDIVGVRNLQAGDDTRGSGLAEYSARMGAYEKQITAAANNNKAGASANRDDRQEQLQAFANSFIAERTDSDGDPYGFWRDSDQVIHNAWDVYSGNVGLLSRFGYAGNLYDNNSVRMGMFVDALAQSQAAHMRRTGGVWTPFGRVGQTTTDTSGQLGSDIFPVQLAGNLGINAAQQQGGAMLQEVRDGIARHGGGDEGREAYSIELGQRLLKEQGLDPENLVQDIE